MNTVYGLIIALPFLAIGAVLFKKFKKPKNNCKADICPVIKIGKGKKKKSKKSKR